jgi:hypothetical protein
MHIFSRKYINSDVMNDVLSCVYFFIRIRFKGSIRCYQCSSANDKVNDNCGVYAGFDRDRNIPVDCQGDEAVTPGTFCVKITQQSPRGFIWDGRWGGAINIELKIGRNMSIEVESN